MSLGSKLRQINDDAEARKLAEEQQRIARNDAAEKRRVKAIRDKFAEYKERITSAIESGTPVHIGKMPDTWLYRGSNPSCYINNPRHPDYALWMDFADWAQSEGLKVEPADEHDGMGMESWRVLSVKPL